MKKLFLTLTLVIFIIPIGISQDLPSYVPSDGLVAYYPFNGNANDASGNGNQGTVNGATLTSDRDGNEESAFYFSGSNCSTRIDANVDMSTVLNSMTVSMWINKTGDGCIFPRVFDFYDGGDSSNDWGEAWGNNTNFNNVSSIVNSNVWYQLVITTNTSNNEKKYYVNGILEKTTTFGKTLPLSGDLSIGRMNHPAYDAFNGVIDDFGIWNRALTEQEIQNLYISSTGDIILNGTVSAENNQIKNVADPTEAQDAVTMAYLQTKLDELTNRVKYLEDTAPNKPSGTWTKVFDLENLPENFDFTSMQKVTQYSYNKTNKEVYFLNRNKNSLLVYDIDMNTFNEINVDYQISSGGAYIYNPQKNTIEYLRAGRETVYEIDLSSYGSSLVKSSGSDTSHYGANMFYNPFTSEIGQIFGYGWFRVKNSMANLNLENGWVVSIADSDGSPQRRTGAQVFPTKDYKKIIVLGGYGNQSGSQTEDSCSNPNTIPWASDVGVWCFQSDIWEIDLADYSATQISDFNIGMKKSSVMSYNYDKNIIINYAGILPPATYSSSYSQEVANWDFSLLFFDMNNPNLGWQEQSQSGDLPSETLEKGYFIYDENSSLFYYFRNDGVWTLSM